MKKYTSEMEEVNKLDIVQETKSTELNGGKRLY